MSYIPERFKPYELVDKATYEKYGLASWRFISERLTRSLDGLSFVLEKHFNRRIRLVCNNWHWYDEPNAPDYFQWRGLRTNKYPNYNEGSRHSYIPCIAADLDSPELSARALIDFVLEHQDEEWAKYIGGIEIGVNWLHIDCRPRINGKIVTFRQ